MLRRATALKRICDRQRVQNACYGLSGFRGNESGWNFAFQYISCYGLSTCYHAYMRYIVISIHLMLRFI